MDSLQGGIWSVDTFDVSRLSEELDVVCTTMKRIESTVFDTFIGDHLKNFWCQEAVLRQNLNQHCNDVAKRYKDELEQLQNDRAAKEQLRAESSSECEILSTQQATLLAEHDARLYAREQLDESVRQLKKSLDSIADEVNVKTAKLRELNEAQENIVKLYRDRLGLNIRHVRGSTDDAVNIEFQFKYIDGADSQRVFAFSLKLLADKTFSVTDCQPMISDLDVLLGHLNKTNDWHSFIVAVRQRFVRSCPTAAAYNIKNNSSATRIPILPAAAAAATQ